LPLAYVNSENYKSIDVVRSVFTILLHKTTWTAYQKSNTEVCEWVSMERGKIIYIFKDIKK
jgi:hypothetical protein